jgi:ferredoxin
MSKISFFPANKTIEATPDQKLLVAMRKNQIPVRFGCASCKCGTCGIKVSDPNAFAPMKADEQALLKRMKLSENGEIRLACQARCSGAADTSVDVDFQDTYSPDDGDGDGSL